MFSIAKRSGDTCGRAARPRSRAARHGGSLRRAIALAGAALLVASAAASERAIDVQVVVAAPIETVWQGWTTRAGIQTFFAPDAEVDARVGGAFHIHMDPLAEPGMKGADDMRFMALQRPTMLSFDWNAPPSLPEARAQRTFVVVRLAPVDAGSTRVTLHHTGWGDGGEWDKTYVYFDRAWPFILAKLKASFETGPADWSEWMAQLRKAHAAPAATSAPP
ncbi:MAG TPA: SRPBCC domain-containing protein [Caldimonas sp.]|nr:SRPBCC domain-containing protein [Caldimonas sp.]